MGQQHNELTDGLFSAALTKALGMAKGRGGLERFGETMQPVLNLWDRPEWSWLRQEYRCAGRVQQGAVALELSHIAIANPLNSGVLLVIEALDLRPGAAALGVDTSILYAGNWTSSATRATLALSAGVIRMTDARSGGAAGLLRAEVWIGSDPAAQGGITIDADQLAAVNTWQRQLCPPITLSPDSALVMVANTANVALAMRVRGYERRARLGELV